MRGRSWLLLALALLMAAPVLVVLASWLAGPAASWPHLASTVLPGYVGHSLFLALFAGAGTLLIGVGSAWLVTSYRFPGRRLLQWSLLLPMACPAYLIAYTWTGLLASEGWLQQALPLPLPDIRHAPGAGLMLVLVLYPYVYLLSRAAFVNQSAVALEVARTLGAGPWRRFLRVALPLARPAIIERDTELLTGLHTMEDFLPHLSGQALLQAPAEADVLATCNHVQADIGEFLIVFRTSTGVKRQQR